jgi:hypothetical protein
LVLERFTKKMTLPAAMRLKPGPKSGKGGRPPREDSLHTGIRIGQDLREILDSERRNGERYHDTILRLMRERAEASKEVYRLQQLQGGIVV